MEGLWEIMAGWTPFGQAVFLLLVLGAVLGTVERCARYLAVMMRGWPDSGPVEVVVEKEEGDNVVITR